MVCLTWKTIKANYPRTSPVLKAVYPERLNLGFTFHCVDFSSAMDRGCRSIAVRGLTHVTILVEIVHVWFTFTLPNSSFVDAELEPDSWEDRTLSAYVRMANIRLKPSEVYDKIHRELIR